MPTIQSKKYPTDDHIQFIDAGAWAEMQKKGLSRRYKVLDDNDLVETVIPAPENILDLGATDIVVEEIPDREEIKERLDKLVANGVIRDYNIRATTVKLNELLNENKESNND